MSPPTERKPTGAPSPFGPEEQTAILLWISSGKSLRSYCEEDGAPHITTVLRWVAADSVFREQYTAAMKIREEVLFDDLTHIADTPLEGVQVVEDNGPNGVSIKTTKADMTKHREMQINTRKWVLSRMNPKKYGDKIQVAGHDGGALKSVTATMTPQEAADAYAATLNANSG
jgi:hypothetical protein